MMLGVLGAEIHLMPDGTLFIQLGVFLAVLIVLTAFVFRPILRIIDRRRAFTSDAAAEAERLSAEARRAEGERALALAQALGEAERMHDQAIAAARQEAEGIIANARAEGHRRIDAAEVSVESSEEAAAAEIARRAEELAREIVSRVTTPAAGTT